MVLGDEQVRKELLQIRDGMWAKSAVEDRALMYGNEVLRLRAELVDAREEVFHLIDGKERVITQRDGARTERDALRDQRDAVVEE